MKLLRFQKSKKQGKKYDAVLLTPQGKEKIVSFGASAYQHYKDSTGIGAWSHLDHNDANRRRLYRLRHFKEYTKAKKYSPSWLSWNYLW